MKPILSIILPVFNSESEISTCIDSILNQTFKDFELILVDDGSVDSSGTICDRYASQDARIIVKHQKNLGVSVARNNGLCCAKGKYVGFVDSDDWIDTNMYEELVSIMEKKNSDIVICGFDYFGADGKKISDTGLELYKEKSLTQSEMMSLMFDLRQKMFYGAVWNKLIKRELIDNIWFDIGISLFEDWLWLIKVVEKCESCFIVDKVFYHYTANNDNGQSSTRDAGVIQKSLRKEYSVIIQLSTNNPVCAAGYIRFLDDATINIKKIKAFNVTRFKIKWMMLIILMKGCNSHLLSNEKRNKYVVEGLFSI